MKNIRPLSLFVIGILCCTILLCSCGKTKQQPNQTQTDDKQTQNAADGKVDESLTSSVKNDIFENEAFTIAVAKCIGVPVNELTKEHIDSVRYLAVGPEDDGTITVYIGLQDYIEVYFSEDVSLESLEKHVKTAKLEDSNVISSDLGKFKNVNVFELYGIAIDDVSFIENYENLFFGYFGENGITDVSSLADYNPDTLYELDFTGNDIEDWTPLYHIMDKVIVNYTINYMTDEDGNSVPVPFLTKLSDIVDDSTKQGQETEQTEDDITSQEESANEETHTEFTEKEEAKDEIEPSQDSTEQTQEEPEMEFEFSDDWSILFE